MSRDDYPEQLTGAQIEQLKNILTDLFEHDTLEQFLKVHLEFTLYDHFHRSDGLSKIVFGLLDMKLPADGLLPRFLSTLRQEKPNSSRLRVWLESITATHQKPKVTSPPKTISGANVEGRFFWVGVVMLFVTIVMALVAFFLPALQPHQRDLLRYFGSISAGFSAASFLGSVELQIATTIGVLVTLIGRRLGIEIPANSKVGQVTLQCTGGFVLWAIVFFFGFPNADKLTPEDFVRAGLYDSVTKQRILKDFKVQITTPPIKRESEDSVVFLPIDSPNILTAGNTAISCAGYIEKPENVVPDGNLAKIFVKRNYANGAWLDEVIPAQGALKGWADDDTVLAERAKNKTPPKEVKLIIRNRSRKPYDVILFSLLPINLQKPVTAEMAQALLAPRWTYVGKPVLPSAGGKLGDTQVIFGGFRQPIGFFVFYASTEGQRARGIVSKINQFEKRLLQGPLYQANYAILTITEAGTDTSPPVATLNFSDTLTE